MTWAIITFFLSFLENKYSLSWSTTEEAFDALGVYWTYNREEDSIHSSWTVLGTNPRSRSSWTNSSYRVSSDNRSSTIRWRTVACTFIAQRRDHASHAVQWCYLSSFAYTLSSWRSILPISFLCRQRCEYFSFDLDSIVGKISHITKHLYFVENGVQTYWKTVSVENLCSLK